MQANKSVPDLFNDLINHVSTLFRKEVQLARAETGEKVRQATGAIVAMAAGALVLLAGFLVLLDSAVAWLVELGIEVQWSTLIVGLVVAIIGYILLQRGISNIKAANLTPDRTVDQLQHDAQTAREQVR